MVTVSQRLTCIYLSCFIVITNSPSSTIIISLFGLKSTCIWLFYLTFISTRLPTLQILFQLHSHTSSNLLALTFNKQNFYTLSDSLDFVWDFLVGQRCMHIYLEMVKQVETIFEFGLTFASDLAKAIKKDKSWEFVS